MTDMMIEMEDTLRDIHARSPRPSWTAAEKETFDSHGWSARDRADDVTVENVLTDMIGEEWDEESCEEYEKKGDGYNMGLWCCKSWCYVDESCPSAEKSVLGGKELFYSYFACPDDTAALTQCKWQEPIDFGGAPVPL